ncbi:carboxymuconolactone decarboxylase family protein [Halovivax limisalsi]|uniref:carboxymuconolactone decarboxylase family protein n=1 Tax=Halovivax limisalsi TaxID=1453760 RepID=UPI003CCDD8EC
MATNTTPYDETTTDIEETLGLVPGYLAELPEDALVNEWPTLKRFLFGESAIDPKTRELVGLAVAAAIGCEYCRHFHRGVAKLHGASEDELAELAFLASYTPRYSAMIQALDYDLDEFYDEAERIATHVQSQQAAGD